MTISTRTAGFALALAAPALIFLGAASAHAEPTNTHTGPAVTHHEAFPHQTHVPQPGTPTHHHHQNNHAK